MCMRVCVCQCRFPSGDNYVAFVTRALLFKMLFFFTEINVFVITQSKVPLGTGTCSNVNGTQPYYPCYISSATAM